MIVVQNLAKKVTIRIQDGCHAHIIGNSVSGERYRTTMVLLLKCSEINFKGRFLEFRLYHKFADVLPKLSKSNFNKEINNCH